MVKCFIMDTASPGPAIEFGKKGSHYYNINMELVRFCGHTVYSRTTKERKETGPDRYETLQELSADELDLRYSRGVLNLLGSREEVVQALRVADQRPGLKIANPPGIFIAVHSKEGFFAKDEVIVRIRSGDPCIQRKGWFEADKYWKWHDVTGYFRDLPSGTESVIHPLDLVLPLEDLFRGNKVYVAHAHANKYEKKHGISYPNGVKELRPVRR